jgi:hypothetical protein
MNRAQCPGKAIRRHDRKPLQLDTCQIGVGRNDGDRRMGARPRRAFHVRREVEIEGLRLRRTPAEFALLFEGKGPKEIAARNDGRADGIHRDQRPDRWAVVTDRGSAANTALIESGDRTEPGPGVAEREILSRSLRRRLAERAIRRHLAPFLVPAVGEIEENRAGDDGDARRAGRNLKAAPLLLQPGLHARGRVEAVYRPAR